MGKFWESIGENLADRWATVSVPALIFWLGGLLTWASGHGGVDALSEQADRLAAQPGVTQIALGLAALLGIAGSGVLVARLTTPGLRLMEGYWPRPLEFARAPMVKRVRDRADRIEQSFQALAGPVLTGNPPPTAQQRADFIRLTERWRRLPGPDRYQPTRVGNTLRAAETRPTDKYGLDGVALWPHLWLLLPETARSELTAARAALNSSVGACLWGLLFVGFVPWAPAAALVGPVVACLAYLVWVPNRAEVYADLVEAAFDLYRGALYAQLRWPLPDNPDDERIQGRQLTTYLLRGLEGTTPSFTTHSSETRPGRSANS